VGICLDSGGCGEIGAGVLGGGEGEELSCSLVAVLEEMDGFCVKVLLSLLTVVCRLSIAVVSGLFMMLESCSKDGWKLACAAVLDL